MTTASLNHSTLERMARSGAIRGVTVAGETAGWQIVAHLSDNAEATLEARRGHRRSFRTLETAVRYLASMGIARFEVDAGRFDAQRLSATRNRPDSAALMKAKQSALNYLQWFTGEVDKGRIALAAGEVSPLHEVMARLRARATEIEQKAIP